MGREVRMVPPDWQHPKELRQGEMMYKPLFYGGAEEPQAEWDLAAQKWDEGYVESFVAGHKWTLRSESKCASECTYADYAGERPRAEDYMPAFAPDTATHYMMYEDTTEGTPISPAFAAPEELAQWLVDNDASANGDQCASYEGWLRVAKGGFAPSMVMDAKGIRPGVDL